MKKLLFFLAGILFLTGLAAGTPPPTPDPRIEKIKAQLAMVDLFGLQAPTGIQQASMIDFAGVGAGLSGCPPAGKARAFYDVSVNQFKVIDSGCNVIIGGGGGTFPRLDQVLNQNQNKLFDQGSATLGFTNGPGLNLSGETSPFTVPSIANCTTSANAQFCFDTVGLNYHGFINGTDQIFGVFTAPFTGTDGDVAGFKVTGGQTTLQDLGPVDATGVQTFTKPLVVAPLDSDVICFGSGGPPSWFNCTPGVAGVAITGSTSTFTIATANNFNTIDHDSAASASVTVTLPTADTLLIPAFGFRYTNHSTHADTITPTTWTINGSASLAVPITTSCAVWVDPNSATNWLADCTSTNASGSISGALSSPHVPVATGATTLADSSITDDGSAPTRTPFGVNTAVQGNYDEWTVDAGGVTANKLVCRSSSNKVQICAINTTQGVIGVALTTQTNGQTVKVCWAAKCSPISTNATTTGHWLIPSTSVAGDVDDTGSATQPTGTATFLAESTVGGGAQVLTTLLAADTVNANGGGKGTIQVNGVTSQPVSNFVNGTGITLASSNSGNVTTITPTVNSPTGSIAGSWQNVTGSSYTVVDGNNQNTLRFTGTNVAVTLPTPNTITTNPFVAMRVQSNAQGSSSFTSGSFTPTVGNQLWISIQENDNKTISALSLSTGETCTAKSSTVATNATFTYYCPSLLGTAKTLSITFSGAPAGATGVFAVELTGTGDDNSSTTAAAGFTSQSLTNTVHFLDAVSMVGSQNGVLPAPPWIEIDTLSNANIGQAFYRLLSNTSSVTASVTGSHTLAQTILSTSAHPSFTAGWYFVVTNASTTHDIVTPTASTINGQTTLDLAPNESCLIMSNGANWDTRCDTSPNLINNGVSGQPTIVFGRDAAGQTGAIGDTSMVTAPTGIYVYRFAGTINCATTVNTATATLNLKWTDTSNTAQTTSVTATCTTLGAASVGHIDQTIRVKGSTAPTYGVTVANSPNYDVSIRLENF